MKNGWKLLLVTTMGLWQLVAVPKAFADDSTSSDVNLALNQPYQMGVPIPDSKYHGIETALFPDSGTKLTDGDTGPSSWGVNGPWVGYLRQNEHDAVVDLGKEQTVHKVDAWFLQDNASGIRFPRRVIFSVSEDGQRWHIVGSVKTATPLSDTAVKKQQYILTGLHVSARYVKYTFYTDVWCFLSELGAWGRPGISSDVQTTQNMQQSEEQHHEGYPMAGSKQAGGKKHEVLIYNGYYSDPSVGKWTTDSFLPYVAYVDQNQQIKDYMFDSFLFTPFGGAPSGGNYGTGSSTKCDWQYYADQLFQPSQQFDALNQTVAKVEAALPNRKYQAKVVVAIPFPGIGSDWGDGLDFNPADEGQDQSLENRVAAVKWYTNYVLSKWNAAGYKNLTLSGFYWLPENVYFSLTPNDEKLIQEVGKLVHGAGDYTFDWVPFNESEGFRDWSKNSFDTALMQPNYAWGAGPDRLQDNATLASMYGLGVEMEFDYPVLGTTSSGVAARENYTQYLDASYTYHYQNSFLAWYQGYQVLLNAEQSASPDIRQIYEETYQFINGTYQPSSTSNSGIVNSGTPGNIGNVPSSGGRLSSGESRDNPNPEAERSLVRK